MLTANACCHCVCVAIALCECVLTIGSVSTTFRCRAGHRTFFSIYLRLTRSGGFAVSHCFQKRHKNIENTHIPFVSQPTWGWPGAGLMHLGVHCETCKLRGNETSCAGLLLYWLLVGSCFGGIARLVGGSCDEKIVRRETSSTFVFAASHSNMRLGSIA